MKQKRLMVCESSTSMWNYHLRIVKEGEEKLGGGAGKSLCDKPMGWDTNIPLSAYGSVSHIDETWCKICYQIASKAEMPGSKDFPQVET